MPASNCAVLVARIHRPPPVLRQGDGAAPPVAGQALKIIATVKRAGEICRQAMRRPR